jgi:[ribosomal protein S18]-alanine N-acetyltransferase
MSDLPPRIRPHEPDDFEALFQIDQICFPADIAFSQAEMFFYLNHPKSIAWVAEGSGSILGFILARIDSRSRAHVLTLDVVPEARKRKIGTALMDRLHQELENRQIKVSILEVGVRNVPAQRLYEKLCYEYAGTLTGYYRGREDAYRMTRTVGSRQSI